MRVLIIGHNDFNKNSNMGKTLLSYFTDFSPEELAQFYIKNEFPSEDSVCRNYYRFTDKDAVRSINPLKKRGRVMKKSDFVSSDETRANNSGSLYQIVRQRTPFTYFARNTVWSMARWKTKEFVRWMDDFDPDVIFFMSGDYGFMYDVAVFAAEHLQKPVVAACVDDYYIYNKNASSLAGRMQHKRFMKHVNRLMEKTSCILTISDTMRDAYTKLFHKPCFTLHTSVERKEPVLSPSASHVAYFGNLDFDRFKSLIEIGLAVKELRLPECPAVDVYSGETNPEYYKDLTEENGVRFHGYVNNEEMAARRAECVAVIHTESFDPIMRERVRFSVSTKIAESLMYGPCLIAYGPEDIASIEYLKENNAAFVITRPEDLASGMREILTNQALREEIVANARRLAAKNHDTAMMSKKVRSWLQEAIDSSK